MNVSTDRDSHDIKTFVFLDLEATDLPSGRPRITEISLVSIHKHILDHCKDTNKVPRVINKLVAVICPMKPISKVASDITGLYNEDLEYQKDFDKELVETIMLFLDRHEKPICLVAHNGYRFDYPLLRSEYDSLEVLLPEDLLCMDTLVMLRELDEEKERLQLESALAEKDEPSSSESSGQEIDGKQGNSTVTQISNHISYRTPERNFSTNVKCDFEDDVTKISPTKKPKLDHKADDIKVNRKLMFGHSSEVNLVEPSLVYCGKGKSSGERCSTNSCTDINSSTMPNADGDRKEVSKETDGSNTDTSSEEVEPNQMCHTTNTTTTGQCEAQGMVDFLTDLISTGQFESLDNFESDVVSEEVGSEDDNGNGDGNKKIVKDQEYFESGDHTGRIGDSIVSEEMVSEADNADDMKVVRDSGLYQREGGKVSPDSETQKRNAMEKCYGEVPEEESEDGDTSADSYSSNTSSGKVIDDVDGNSNREFTTGDHVTCVSPPLVQRVANLVKISSVSSEGIVDKSTFKPSCIKASGDDRNIHHQNATSDSHTLSSSNATNQPLRHTSVVTSSATQYKQYKYSYKLPDVHERVVGFYPSNSHSAEDDCIAMLRICQKLAPDFIQWTNKNAVAVNQIEAMYPKSPRKRKVLDTGILPYNA